MDKFCNECNEPISEKEYIYSKDHFSRPLCRKHQTNNSIKKSYSHKPQPTDEARRLGELLSNMGHNVEFEKFDGYKHIDIAIVKSKVNIEVDGRHHQGKNQALRDLKRTFYSWNKDFVTLRIPNSLTENDGTIQETAGYIDKFLKKGRTKQLKEELDKEQKEDYPFWEDVNKLINGASNVISNVFKSFK
jgi:very-short-patch-repair endonuclease